MVNYTNDSIVLRDYLLTLRNYPLLSATEELELAKEMRTSPDEDERNAAREQLINSNLRLVVSIAKRYYTYSLSLMDIIQEGNLGLMTAVDRFDPFKTKEDGTAYRFSTFAVYWIKQAIAKAINDCGRPIRLPVSVISELSTFNTAYQLLSDRLHREPTDAELAQELRVNVDRIHQYRIWRSNPDSLEEVISSSGASKHDDEKAITLLDTLADENESPEAAADQGLKQRAIDRALTELGDVDPRGEVVLRLRFGLGVPKSKFWKEKYPTLSADNFRSLEGPTLDEVGSLMKLTRERVRQLERQSENYLAYHDVHDSLKCWMRD